MKGTDRMTNEQLKEKRLALMAKCDNVTKMSPPKSASAMKVAVVMMALIVDELAERELAREELPLR